MRRLLDFSILLILASCDSGSSPTAPPPPAVATNWSGSRAVVALPVGEGTCLGNLLSSRQPTPVEVWLPPSPNVTHSTGDVTATSPYWDGCSTIVQQVGSQVTWTNFRCSASCWLEEFQCGTSRVWTYCRSWGNFSGTISGDRLIGTQIETFEAISGNSRYAVSAEVEYDLRRN
jgi:hypothetical protein